MLRVPIIPGQSPRGQLRAIRVDGAKTVRGQVSGVTKQRLVACVLTALPRVASVGLYTHLAQLPASPRPMTSDCSKRAPPPPSCQCGVYSAISRLPSARSRTVAPVNTSNLSGAKHSWNHKLQRVALPHDQTGCPGRANPPVCSAAARRATQPGSARRDRCSVPRNHGCHRCRWHPRPRLLLASPERRLAMQTHEGLRKSSLPVSSSETPSCDG